MWRCQEKHAVIWCPELVQTWKQLWDRHSIKPTRTSGHPAKSPCAWCPSCSCWSCSMYCWTFQQRCTGTGLVLGSGSFMNVEILTNRNLALFVDATYITTTNTRHAQEFTRMETRQRTPSKTNDWLFTRSFGGSPYCKQLYLYRPSDMKTMGVGAAGEPTQE